jgi:hypothetical protein
MKGCGAVYDSVSTDYFNSKDLIGDIKDIRPDLPYIERY